MVGLVFFRSENNYDKHYFRAKLARGQEVHCQIDLGKEGELKYLLQPNIYTLYLRLMPEDKQAQLRCEGEGPADAAVAQQQERLVAQAAA